VRRKASAAFLKKTSKKLLIPFGHNGVTGTAPAASKFFVELGVRMTRSFAVASESGRQVMIKTATAACLSLVHA
jgi:hypothetical protein